TVVGMSFLRASATNGDRRMVGAYTRLGFGRWGIFAEHDITDRTLSSGVSFRQHATYAESFYAFREWLVGSVIGEHLSVARPYSEDLNAGKLQLSARLRSQFTVSVNFKMQRNMLNGVWSP